MELIDSSRRFTALFASSDIMAFGAKQALEDRGFSIPDGEKRDAPPHRPHEKEGTFTPSHRVAAKHDHPEILQEIVVSRQDFGWSSL